MGATARRPGGSLLAPDSLGRGDWARARARRQVYTRAKLFWPISCLYTWHGGARVYTHTGRQTLGKTGGARGERWATINASRGKKGTLALGKEEEEEEVAVVVGTGRRVPPPDVAASAARQLSLTEPKASPVSLSVCCCSERVCFSSRSSAGLFLRLRRERTYMQAAEKGARASPMMIFRLYIYQLARIYAEPTRAARVSRDR